MAWRSVQAAEGVVKARRFDPLVGWYPLHTFAHAGSTHHVLAASWEPAHGVWSSLEVVATTAYDHFRPVGICAWRGGHAYVSWLAADGDPATDTVLAAGRWIGPAGALGPTDDFNDGTNEGVSLPGVGIDREGRGVVVWSELVGGTSVMNQRLID